MSKTKIFVSAYACEPDHGSEIGVGWHWVLEMSKYFELWVLTRKSNQENIEQWLAKNPATNEIHFVYYDLPDKLRFWKKGMRGVRTYYSIWQSRTNKIVKKTMIENDIKIYHLLTYGNALWKASKFGMKQTFIWGPTGGVDTIPKEYSKHYTAKARFIEWARRCVVKMLPINHGFKKRCKNADLILCKSYNMQNAVPEKYRDKAKLFTDVAVDIKEKEVSKALHHSTKFLAVGKLDAWRGFDLLIEAFALALKENENITLDILGIGIDDERIHRLIQDFGVASHVNQIGEVRIDEYEEYMSDCDVVVNPALKEGAVTVSFDSMAYKKPLICVDTGGYTRYFTNDYAVVLKREGRAKLIRELKTGILKMTDELVRRQLGEKAFQEGMKYTWEDKGKEIEKLIIGLIKE